MARGSLQDRHLAELHALASERGIDGYRMLTRDELIEQLGDGDGGDEVEGDSGERGGVRERPRSRRGRGRGRRGRGARDRDGAAEEGDGGREEEEQEEDEVGEPVSGVLEITSRGHGFVRVEGLDSSTEDIYVSPSQIRRCELQAGDQIAGPARKPRRGERHPALVHIDTVNGQEPGAERTRFAELEAVPPHRRLPLAGEAAAEDEKLLLRAIDLLVPLARGQRVLVNASRGAGRTTLLRALAAELSAVEDLDVVVVLVDERPEERSEWEKAVPDAELAIAGAELRPGEQLRIVELAVARAKRRAEAGGDVALLIDSLSRLAVAADDPGAAKPIFAAGRETAEEDAGSLTVIATALTDAGDDGVARALETTENATITLDAELTQAGIYPALDVGGCRVGREETLRSDAELAGARALRAELAGLPARDAAERLVERLKAVPTNESLLAALGE
jgi:transcription termination factor Rho